ncbi:MAG: hypothetical protein Q9227_002805 [Pyrenula ochraceoflavens]
MTHFTLIDPHVAGVFGDSSAKDRGSSAIAGLIPEPNGDRGKSNVRIYCDNDPQEKDGSKRWTLKADPPENQRGQGYVLQKDRPRWGDQSQAPGNFWQEWVDNTNGVVMPVASKGCQNPGTQGETYTVPGPLYNPGPGRWTRPRATITICNRQLMTGTGDKVWYLHSLAALPEAGNLESLTEQPLDDMPSAIDNFQLMTSFIVFHELTHAVAQIEDQFVGGQPQYQWAQCLALTGQNCRNNVNNFAYFALLAKLRDRQWGLSTDDAKAKTGVLQELQSQNNPTLRRHVERCAEEMRAGREAGRACLELIKG